MPPPEKRKPLSQEERLELLKGFKQFAPACLKIQNKSGHLIDFEFNEVQLCLHDILDFIRSLGCLVRVVILKARRKGISTYVSGRFFYSTIRHFNHYSMQITHEPEATNTLFSMVKRFLVHLQDELKPVQKYNNRKELEFNTPDGMGLDSKYTVGTAGKDDFGSGQLVHKLHISELSKWPAHTADDLLTSVLQCVPRDPISEVIIESTAKGVGGVYYDMFWACRFLFEVYLDENRNVAYRITVNEKADESNAYFAVFIPWFVFKEYQMPVPVGFKRDEEEENLVTIHGWIDEQLVWRRFVIQNECRGDKDKFKQEYPSTPREAFLASGRQIFDAMNIELLMKAAPKPIARYECMVTSGTWIQQINGRLSVWEEPKPGRPYVIGSDVAEGHADGDYSCCDVLDHLTGKQVAHWHGHMDAKEYGRFLAWLGIRYNTALLGVERNNLGIATVGELCDLPAGMFPWAVYPNQWVETIPDPPNKPRPRYGWLTSKKTKPMIVERMLEVMSEPDHGINNSKTFEEMLYFVESESVEHGYGAEPGHNDDRVMSIMIAKHIAAKTKPHQNVARSGNTRRVPAKEMPASAWT